jgi:3-oxoadipate enol-lactonase
MIRPVHDHSVPDFELVRSSDGTYVAARALSEEGPGLPLLVVNAVGADLSPWRRALTDVARTRPVVTWDHRGMHDSGPPAGGRLEPSAHAEDALAVLDHHDIGRCAAVAWSNGGRIALELAAGSPHRVAGIALVCAAYGQPFERFVSKLEPGALLPGVAGAAAHAAPLLEPAYRALAAWPELPGVLRQAGLIGPTADTEALGGLMRAVARCDLRRLLRAYEELTRWGEDGLPARTVQPALLAAGGRDQVVSLTLMRELAEALPAARLEVYDDATHFLPIEYPARLSDDLRAFLATLD